MTRLRFTVGGSTFDADERRGSVAATFEQRLSNRWTLDATAGVSAPGTLRPPAQSFDISPGGLGAVAVSYRPLDDRGSQPFVLLSLAAAASYATTSPTRTTGSSEALVATDVRLGVTAGKTIARVMTPYLAARVFGGPVLWTYAGQSATGTDAYHYPVGGGFSLALGRVDVHMEVAPLGERSLAAGAGLAF